MSLIGDLRDLYVAESGLFQDSASSELVPLGAAKQSADVTDPPVPYTAPGAGSAWSSGMSRTAQLDLTTSESTLFSTLELIAMTTASVEWTAHRPAKPGAQPDQDRPVILPRQNHAVALWHQPNTYMTGDVVRQIATWHYRSVGEAWFVIDYFDAGMTLPRAWWPVRPDRMNPKPDADHFLAGYTYSAPSGDTIDLDQREVLRLINPHPTDIHRGIGVVHTLGTILGTSLNSAQWIANFFMNDATPGGILEFPEGLEDAEYNKVRRRWNDQHRGVSKAHRVAILEWGTFKPRSYSLRDLQFPEVRRLSRDQILEAFRLHKHNLGISEDVNRASAEAALVQLARNETKPNLRKWAALANGPYKALFGAAGEAVEFCYPDPEPEDREQNRQDDIAKVDNYVKLIGAGVESKAASEYLGMPVLPLVAETTPDASNEGGKREPSPPAQPESGAGELDETKKGDPLAVGTVLQKVYLAVEGDGKFITKTEARQLAVDAGADIDPEDWQDDGSTPSPGEVPEVASSAPAPAGQGSAGESGTGLVDPALRETGTPALLLSPWLQLDAQGRPVRATGPGDDIDLSGLSSDWQDILDRLLDRWPGILDDQYSALARQVRDAINTNDLEALTQLVCPDEGAQDTLSLAMVAAAAAGAAAVVREADAQGVDIGARVPDKTDLDQQATVITGLMRNGLAVAAGQAAMRVLVPGASGEDIAEQVRDHLDSLTDAEPKRHLGGAITMAQNAGRVETMAAAPVATYYATEQLDSATCGPCARVDGKRYNTLEESKEDYPTSGYRKCEGLERCRGTVVAVWTVEKDSDE